MELTIRLNQEEMTSEKLALIGELTGVKIPEIKEAKKRTRKHTAKEVPEEEAPAEEAKAEEPAEETKEEALAEEETKEEAAEEEKPLTLADIKALGVELSRKGKKEEVKAVISSFGVKALSEIPEEQYSEVVTKLEELKD
ncbi:MAG: hypothetical protein ACI3ZR_07320 [bacterium]